MKCIQNGFKNYALDEFSDDFIRYFFSQSGPFWFCIYYEMKRRSHRIWMYKILPLWIWYLCIPFLVPHFEMMHSNYEKERKKSSWLLIKVWNPIAIALPLIWYGVEFFWWISLRLDQLHSVWKSLKMLKKASFGFFFSK